MSDNDPRYCNKRKVAEILGVTDRALSDWQKETPPLPVYKHGSGRGGSVYDLHEVVKWFVSRQTEDSGMLNSRNERARKDKAMADKYVRENRIAEGELLTVGEVVRIVSDANHRAKTRLLRLPRAIAIAVPRECAREAEAESENLINEALEELANPDEFRSDSIEGEPCDSADLEASA